MTIKLDVTYQAPVPVMYTPMEEFLALVPDKRSGLRVTGGWVELVAWSGGSHQYDAYSYSSISTLTIEELSAYEERNQ